MRVSLAVCKSVWFAAQADASPATRNRTKTRDEKPLEKPSCKALQLRTSTLQTRITLQGAGLRFPRAIVDRSVFFAGTQATQIRCAPPFFIPAK